MNNFANFEEQEKNNYLTFACNIIINEASIR